ncbi:uncharacterized protein C7orf50 homolog isoform X1 [Acinonyx jubatus]|uniref:Uncharacterized protein C7orf50 homolog isoform X1 n=1 Tax=Acinonyx jubatus TaxID=32536 RepID=A0ABM3PBT6_ACIJB|nr:uncharacterized protein C7orf50 homolog isoform X1 [Acinonyx jubatus]
MGRETGSTWGRCSCGFPPPLSGPGQGLLTGRPPGEGPVAATWWCGGHRQVVPSLHSRSRQPPSTGSLRGPRLASPACFADPAGAGVRAHVQAPGPRPHPRAPPRLRHRPAGWIRFQPSRAGVTCAVRGRCGRAARGPLAARDAEGGAAWGAGQDTALELPELTPEEKRVLERKLKKERRKEERKQLRKDAAPSVPAKPSGAQLALDYLRGWAQKHENWKFQKTRQTWLLLHMYDNDQVPDELFSTLLAYLEGLRGRARELTVQKAEALMQKSDEARGADTLPLGTIQRVRQVLQLLS